MNMTTEEYPHRIRLKFPNKVLLFQAVSAWDCFNPESPWAAAIQPISDTIQHLTRLVAQIKTLVL